MSEHRFNQPWQGCMLSADKRGGLWQHYHAMNEPCPLNNNKPWGISWRAADIPITYEWYNAEDKLLCREVVSQEMDIYPKGFVPISDKYDPATKMIVTFPDGTKKQYP